ncbi:MAG TPA: signal peptidase I [Ktedonobacter sp.]|nr:signal peptidase I [Ktedonobacter sp.]
MNPELDFEKRYRLVREVIETIVLTVLMFLIIRLAVQNFQIQGHSMEPSFHDQELVLVDKWTYLFHAPARGDVIVFVAPPQPDQDYIKRVVGLPGDVVTVQGTQVYINGKLLQEPYVKPYNQGNQYSSFTNRVIPPNDYFVFGDNRNGSSDSRDWGCLPRANIIGRVGLVYWPFGQDNTGLIPNYSSTYTSIPVPPKTNSTDICPISPNERLFTGSALHSSPASSSNMENALVLLMPGLFVFVSGNPLRWKQGKSDNDEVPTQEAASSVGSRVEQKQSDD